MLIDPYAGTWETRYSSRGFPYQVWQRTMPWIDPANLECTVYLYPSERDAEDGSDIGGSGFFVGAPVEGSKHSLLCIVTNRHVIDRGNMVARINTIDGGHDIVALDDERQHRWYRHPSGDDLAVCPINLSIFHRVRYVPAHSFITKQTIEDFEIGPGDEVYFVGRFVNHEGKQRNLPSVRFGNISQMPWEPIVVEDYPQESFLVEARSISGYSGSPVFVYIPPAPMQKLNWTPEGLKMIRDGTMQLPGVSKKRINIPIQMGPWLLGVDYCHLRGDEHIWSRTTQKPVNDEWFVKSNTGMMGVVPAWKLADILNGAEMKPIFDAAKEAANKDASVELDAATLAQSAAPAKDENPQGREDFTALLGEAARKQKRDD